jgi:esterase/lipase superfamily enzyme
MGKNKMVDELINHVVNSTQHVVLIDPTHLKPIGLGSGCIINYRNTLFFVSVQQVAAIINKQIAIDTGTNIYVLPTMNIVDKFNSEGLPIGKPMLQKLESLDICYTEIEGYLDSLRNDIYVDDNNITTDRQRLISTNLDYEPTIDEGYSFYGTLKSTIANTLNKTDKVVLDLTYDGTVGPFDRFVLNKPIDNELDYQASSGAPLFSETGDLLAFVAHGFVGENYLYGFSARELRKYLDKYLDSNKDVTRSDTPLLHDDRNDAIFDAQDSFISPPLRVASPLLNSNIFKTGKNKETSKYISFPLLYGTNRKYETTVNTVQIGNERDTTLHLGLCEVSIPNSHKMGEIERPGWFRKLFFHESAEKDFTLLRNELIDTLRFVDLLSKKIGDSDENDVLLFIHGFNVSFKDAMFRTAQLGYDLNFKGGVTAYSWPSAGSIDGYIADTDSSQLSSDYLCDFIKLIIGTGNIMKLHIIAHSMGNVVLTGALMQLKSDGLYPHAIINQIILAAPDIDKDLFITHIMPTIKRDRALTLYVSDKDNALLVSKDIRKGHQRLGEGGNDIVVLDGLDSIDASNVDTSLLGHGYFSDTQSLINDIHMTLLGVPPKDRILDPKQKVVAGTPKVYWAFRNS